MQKVRILQSVAGLDFSWIPGEIVDMSDEDAAKWADGERGELVDPPAKAVKPAVVTPEDSAPAAETPEDNATLPVRRAGRPRKS